MINNKSLIKPCFLLAWAALLAGCASIQPDLSKELADTGYLNNAKSTKYSGEVFSNEDENATDNKEYEFFPGTGEFINSEAASRHTREVSEKGEITFNFEGEPVQAVAHLILGEILKENYVMAPGVSGNVTFATARPVGKDQVIPILEMLLSWNNAALVMVNGRYHVMPENQAIAGNLTPITGSLVNKKGYQVYGVPLEFIAPTEMEKLLEPYAKKGAIVKADNARNMLFLAGTKAELANYLQTIEIFDVDWLAGMSTGIFYLQRVEAVDVITELEAIFGEGAETPLAGMFRFMPLERLNAILVITPQEDYLHKAHEWVNRLDRSGSENATNLYVYNVKNVKAVDLAGYLNDVFGGSSGSYSSRRAEGGNVVPGQSGREISSTNANNAANNRATQRPRRNTSGGDDNGIQITAIEESNQLLISGNVQQYESIMAAIKRLDIEPLQVMIEAKIIEVSLNESLAFGVQWFFGEDVPSTSGGSTALSEKGYNISTAGSTIGDGIPGSPTLSYVFKGKDIQARLSALDATGLLTVLSSPALLVLNNKSASINVGDEIPTISNSIGTIGTGDLTRSSVSFRQTGVQLEVTPRVNPGGLVYLELSQDVSVPSDTTDSTGNRTVSRREITTEIAVQSGNTIVMGGLISENKSSNRSGLPFVSRIPVVGNMFGRKSKTSDRTELMVLITPTVIENPEQARTVTLEYAKKFQGLKPISTNSEENDEDN